MSDDEFTSLARSYRRRLYAVVPVLVAGLFLLGWLLASTVGLLPWYIYPFPLFALLYVPLFSVDGRQVLETDKSSGTVRHEFLGPEAPTFALPRAFADEVAPHDDGVSCTTTNWGVTRTFGYEAATGEDGGVVLTNTRGGIRGPRNGSLSKRSVT